MTAIRALLDTVPGYSPWWKPAGELLEDGPADAAAAVPDEVHCQCPRRSVAGSHMADPISRGLWQLVKPGRLEDAGR